MVDFSALSKWPNVPACYGWLSLDCRGRWRLQGEVVQHAGLIDFIQRQYGSDEQGCWFVQNGPQRVFVDLAYTPWVARWTAGASISLHTDQTTDVAAVFLDEEGNLLFKTPQGLALLDDRDLANCLAACLLADGSPPSESDWLGLMTGEPVSILWEGLPITRVLAVDLPKCFNFVTHPAP